MSQRKSTLTSYRSCRRFCIWDLQFLAGFFFWVFFCGRGWRMGWKVLSTGSCVCVGASSADGCQMSLAFQTSQLASLKGIILTNTHRWMGWWFSWQLRKQTCVFYLYGNFYFFLPEKVPLWMPQFPWNKHSGDSQKTFCKWANVYESM